MKGVLQVGFYNYISVEHIIGIVDYKLLGAKKIVKSAREERPRSVLDCSKARKARSLIILTGDRYIISAIYPKILARRLGEIYETEEVPDAENS